MSNEFTFVNFCKRSSYQCLLKDINNLNEGLDELLNPNTSVSIKPVRYLQNFGFLDQNYQPFTSFAPYYDITDSNIDKEDTKLLFAKNNLKNKKDEENCNLFNISNILYGLPDNFNKQLEERDFKTSEESVIKNEENNYSNNISKLIIDLNDIQQTRLSTSTNHLSLIPNPNFEEKNIAREVQKNLIDAIIKYPEDVVPPNIIEKFKQ